MGGIFTKEIEFAAGSDLDQAYEKLKQCDREYGCICVGDFNGVMLDSTMSIDTCYKKVIGISKEEFDKQLRLLQVFNEKEEEEYEQDKEYLIEMYANKAELVLKAEDLEDFNRVLNIRMNDMYHGMEVKCMFDIIDILVDNKDDMEQAMQKSKQVFDRQDHSGMSAGLTAAMVKRFSPVFGEEFYKKVYKE